MQLHLVLITVVNIFVLILKNTFLIFVLAKNFLSNGNRMMLLYCVREMVILHQNVS